METASVEGVVRPVLETERRAMRRALWRRRRHLHHLKQRIFAYGAVLFGVLWGLTIVASRDSVVVVTIFWLVVGSALTLWSYFSAKTDLTRQVTRFEEPWVRNEVNEVRVQSMEMVEFEEEEDEGACYAFQLDSGRILLISGQGYYPSARFPNTDFSLARFYDNNGICIEELIHKRGHKLKPSRIVPAKVKSALFIPGHLEMIEGKISEVEGLMIGTQALETTKHV